MQHQFTTPDPIPSIQYADCPATRADERRLAREQAQFLEWTHRAVGGGSERPICRACGEALDADGACYSLYCPEGLGNVQRAVAADAPLDWPPVDGDL